MIRRVLFVALAFLSLSPNVSAQAVYGSIAGTVIDPSGGVLPGVTVTITSTDRKTVDSVVTNEAGQYVKERLLPGSYEVKVELQGFKQVVYPDIQVERRHPNAARRKVAGRRGHGGHHGRGLQPASQDRPRRRGDDVRFETADRPAGARSQLHQVRAAHARHAAARLAACREREPARIDADDGQRAALQRDDLPARRHREPRSDSRHHRHQPDARVDSARRRSRRRTTMPSSARPRPASCRSRRSRARTKCTAARSGSTSDDDCRRGIRSPSSGRIP